MARKTLAQKHADRQLDEALARTIEAYEFAPKGSILIDYILVCETITPEVDDDGETDRANFTLAFRNGMIRASVAYGLLEIGKDLLGGMTEDRDG